VINIDTVIPTDYIFFVVIKFVSPFVFVDVIRGHSRLFSTDLGVWQIQYQGGGPENCKNTKFGKHSWWMELPNFNGFWY